MDVLLKGGVFPERAPQLTCSNVRLNVVAVLSDHLSNLRTRGEDRTAFVALSLPKIKAILGAHGCFLSQRLPVFLHHSNLGLPSLVFHQEVVAGLPFSRPHHQHLSDGNLWVLLHRQSPVVKCPDRSL